MTPFENAVAVSGLEWSMFLGAAFAAGAFVVVWVGTVMLHRAGWFK